jgi:hypothetical protein
MVCRENLQRNFLRLKHRSELSSCSCCRQDSRSVMVSGETPERGPLSLHEHPVVNSFDGQQSHFRTHSCGL